MKDKINSNIRKDRAITLIALIITIIILVVLATVAINSLMNSRMIEIAADGTRKLCSRTKKRRRNI